MKQVVRTILFAALALALASPAAAQNDQLNLQLGVRGGVQLTQMSFSGDALRPSNRSGYSVGPVLRFKTPVVGLGVDVGVLYDARDLKVEGQVLRQQSVLVPANARLGATIFNTLGVFISAGPQMSFNVGDDLLHWVSEEGKDRQYMLQNTTLSLNLGAGVTFGKHLEGTVYYNLPLGKTGDFTWNSLSEQLQSETWSRARSKTDVWRFCVTYYF